MSGRGGEYSAVHLFGLWQPAGAVQPDAALEICLDCVLPFAHVRPCSSYRTLRLVGRDRPSVRHDLRADGWVKTIQRSHGMDRRLLAWAQAAAPGGALPAPAQALAVHRRAPAARSAAVRRPDCRVVSPAWCCAMTASRAAQRSDATSRGSAGRAALRWWLPGDTRLAAALRRWRSSARRALARVPLPTSWSDHQFRPRAGGPATRAGEPAPAGFPVPGLCRPPAIPEPQLSAPPAGRASPAPRDCRSRPLAASTGPVSAVCRAASAARVGRLAPCLMACA